MFLNPSQVILIDGADGELERARLSYYDHVIVTSMAI